MNKYLSLITVVSLFMVSCKEEPPGVNYNPPTSTYDTTYIAEDVPAAQPKEILLEDVTGTSCPNCPEAAAIAKSIKANHADRFNVIALYNTISGALGNPINHNGVVSAFDFRNKLATEITQMVGIPSSLPSGYINRNKFTGKIDPIMPRDEWANAVNEELAKTTPVNLNLTSSFNAATSELTTEVEITYTALVTVDNFISISILEDSIVDAQESKDLNTGNVTYIPDYVHKHVMRDMYTASVGDLINTSNKITLTPGRVIKRRYTKKIVKLTPYAHLKVVAFVHEGPATKYVLQSKEAEVD